MDSEIGEIFCSSFLGEKVKFQVGFGSGFSSDFEYKLMGVRKSKV